MNGWVTIGTKLDTKQLEQDLKRAESELKKYENEATKLTEQKAKVELDLTEYEQRKQAISDSTNEELKFAQTTEQVNNVLDMEKIALQDLTNEYSKQFGQIDSINEKLQENATNQSAVKERVAETSQKIAQANEQMNRTAVLNEMGKGFDNISRKLSGIVSGAVKWGLAIFSVRTAYNFLTSSISTISQYNKQVGTDIQYIRFALASTLEPVVLRLINLVKTLLYYINYIAKAWFGVNLFAGASAKKFQDSQKSLKGASKSAKELKNQLAGFDEMNVLQDNTSGGGGGGGDAGVSAPSFDLSGIEGKIPDWLQWIVDHKDEVLAFLFGALGALAALKLGLTGIQALGIGIALAGILYAFEGLKAYLEDPSWKNFGKIIQGIGIFIVGLGIAIGSVPLIVAGAVVLIVGTIVKYWEQIKAFLQKGIDWLTSKSEAIHKKFGDVIGEIYDTFTWALQGMLNGFDNVFKGLKKILDGIITFVTGVFTGNWKKAWEGVKQIFSGVFQALKGVAQTVLSAVLGVVFSIATAVGNVIQKAFKAVINGVLSAIENILNSPIRQINTLIGVINAVPGINLKKLPTFKLPRLAKGGIVNQPGRGVPIGGATTGERGREGVIPLTDSQQMALLGEAIGKYITVNANITNTMNGRVISRELHKINNESDFAFNR